MDEKWEERSCNVRSDQSGTSGASKLKI